MRAADSDRPAGTLFAARQSFPPGCPRRHNERVQARPFKIPQSVLVVIHTPKLDVLLISRADAPNYWQSVTGAKDFDDEPLEETARREVMEETGIDCAIGKLED